MGRRRRKEGAQSTAIEELGLGHDIPADDFSDQPGAGSRIGGIRGAQEYGIIGGVAGERESLGGEHKGEDALIDELAAASEGLAEYSAEGIEELEDVEEGEAHGYVSGDDLQNLIHDRLAHNHYLHTRAISVSVDPDGLVTLSGEVCSDAESLRAFELVSSLPGVSAIRNNLSLTAPKE